MEGLSHEGLSLTELHCLKTRLRQTGRLASGKNHQKSPRSLKVRQTPGPAGRQHWGKVGIAAKRKKAGWDNAYLIEVLSGV